MGLDDGYIAEGTQLTQWDGTGFVDVGESSTSRDASASSAADPHAEPSTRSVDARAAGPLLSIARGGGAGGLVRVPTGRSRSAGLAARAQLPSSKHR